MNGVSISSHLGNTDSPEIICAGAMRCKVAIVLPYPQQLAAGGLPYPQQLAAAGGLPYPQQLAAAGGLPYPQQLAAAGGLPYPQQLAAGGGLPYPQQLAAAGGGKWNCYLVARITLGGLPSMFVEIVHALMDLKL